MRIGFVSTRLAGTDGVSLEARKWAEIWRASGHESFYCAGELDEDLEGMTDPLMHFQHPEIRRLNQLAFALAPPPSEFWTQLETIAAHLEQRIAECLSTFRIHLLVIENALAIPMNLPLGVALQRLLARTGMPAIGHHHDFYWERARFRRTTLAEWLDHRFPPDLPNIRHVVINTAAQRALAQRGISSAVVPNIFNFSHAAPGIDDRNANLRATLNLHEDHLFFLQPTRVVRRKGIEHSLTLLRELRRPANRRRLLGKEAVIVVSHPAGDEGLEYLQEILSLARQWRVPFHYAASHFAPRADPQRHLFSLWDAYIHADFVTYPSLYEGFGNALLEAIYFRLPIMVNRYTVFAEDIAPLGFDLIEIEGQVTNDTVEQVIEVIRDPVRRRRMVERNYQLAREHFSYEAAQPRLMALLAERPKSA